MIEQPLFSSEHLPISLPPTLYGRQSQLSRLRDLLSTTGTIWLQGPPGIGRRALAATVATEYLTESGGVLWFTVYHDDVGMLANRVMRAYGVSALSTDDDLGSQLELVQALLEQNRPLVIIEGPIASGVITQFLERCVPPNLPLIMTSNIAVDGPWTRIELGSLNDRNAEQLYRDCAQLDETRRTALLAPLLDYVEGHPLAIVIAGRQRTNAGITSTHFASLLPKAPSGPENRALGVYAAAQSLLDTPAKGLFLLLGALFVDRISLALLEKITGIPEDTLTTFLSSLIDKALCEKITVPNEPSFYRIHDLGRIYARRRLKVAGQLDSIRQRILDGIHSFVLEYTDTPTTDAYNILARDMDHVLGAARYAASQNNNEVLESLFKALGRHGTQNVIHARGYQALYNRLGRLMSGKPFQPEATILDDTSVQFTKPETFEPPPTPYATGEFPAVTDRIDTRRILGMSREALEGALEAALGRQDVYVASRLSRTLGQWYSKRESYEKALQHFVMSVEQCEIIGDQESLMLVLEQTAETLLKLNRALDAQPYVERAFDIANTSNDIKQQGLLLSLLGDIQVAHNDYEAALERYKRAIRLLQSKGEMVQTGLAMSKAATLYMDMNELQDATVFLAQSAALFEKAGRRDLQGQALGSLGTTFGRLGRWKEAGYRHNMALQIARDIEDIEEERFQLSNLAYVCEAEGHIDWAIHYNRQALYLSLIEGRQESIADITLGLGRVLLMDATATNLKQAIELLEKSVDLNPQDEAVRLLGRARRRLERLESAGYAVPSAETDLQAYAQSAYDMSQ